MKKLVNILIFLLLFLCTSCSTQKNIEEITFGSSSMLVSYTMMISNVQLDSICTVDFLPNQDKWISTTFTDYETNVEYLKKIYIKKYSDECEIIYILTGNKEPYRITRRITE